VESVASAQAADLLGQSTGVPSGAAAPIVDPGALSIEAISEEPGRLAHAVDAPLGVVADAAVPVGAMSDVPAPLGDAVAASVATASTPSMPLVDLATSGPGTVSDASANLADVAGAIAPSALTVSGLSTPPPDLTISSLGVVPDASSPFADTVAQAGSPLPDAAVAVGSVHQPLTPGAFEGDAPAGIGGVLKALNPFDGASVTAILATSYMAWKVALVAVVLASLSRLYGNAAGCVSTVRLVLFTNVQLIRCGAVSSVSSMARLATATLTTFANAVPTPTLPPAPTIRRASEPGAAAARGFPRPGSRPLHGLSSDGAVMTRIAELLALVYGALVAIWLWRTRMRWNGR
jgi:hypothetical protein